MSSAGCNAGCQLLAPFADRVVNYFLVQTVQFLLDTLVQLFQIGSQRLFPFSRQYLCGLW